MEPMKQCIAKSKRSGKKCKNYAVNGKNVCYIHGGKSKGPKTKIGKEKSKRANWKHGFYSLEGKQERKIISEMIRRSKNNLFEI